MTHPIAPRLAATLAVLSLAVLAACGGGAGADPSAAQSPGSTAPGTGTASVSTAVSGTITGFGSVILDGKKYDDSSTAVQIATDPKAPDAGALTDLKLGMHIEGVVKDGKLLDAVVHAALSGVVANIDTAAASFTVYGQTVKVSTQGATPTVWDGVADLAGLVAGDVVEVHGSLDAAKALNATRIERKPRSEAGKAVRLGGVITSLDTPAKTFKLNDMVVDYSAAQLMPDGLVLANGQLFEAMADSAPVAGVYKPKTIRVQKAGEGGGLELGGRIMAFVSVADFTVSGQHIDASAATFDGGTVADLATGVTVAAEGTVTTGVLKAKKLRVLKTSTDVAASLKGQVTEFVSAASFKLRGTVVDASASGVVFTGGTVADLGAGAWLLVKGKVSGERITADSVEFQSPPVDKPVTLKGEVREFDAATGSFHFLGATLKLANNVVVEGGALVNLVNGKRVEATGTPGADGVVLVSKLVFLGDLASAASVLGGRLSSLGTTSFKLAGVTVNYAGAVFEGGTAANLADGVPVLAKGVVNGTSRVMSATWIEIVAANASGVRLSGAMGDYVSAADFRVGGQRVDASAAVFTDGVAADLANGRVLDVRGSVVDVAGSKVVKATQVRFLNK